MALKETSKTFSINPKGGHIPSRQNLAEGKQQLALSGKQGYSSEQLNLLTAPLFLVFFGKQPFKPIFNAQGELLAGVKYSISPYSTTDFEFCSLLFTQWISTRSLQFINGSSVLYLPLLDIAFTSLTQSIQLFDYDYTCNPSLIIEFLIIGLSHTRRLISLHF